MSRKVGCSSCTHDDDGDRDVNDRAHDGYEHRSRVSVQRGAIGLSNERKHSTAKSMGISRGASGLDDERKHSTAESMGTSRGVVGPGIERKHASARSMGTSETILWLFSALMVSPSKAKHMTNAASLEFF